MNKQIDRDMVYWMLRTGWHPERIAERLGASRRQIDRITRAHGWSGDFHLKSFEHEHELWDLYHHIYKEKAAKIALRFGRSRQAVYQYFNANLQKSNG